MFDTTTYDELIFIACFSSMIFNFFSMVVMVLILMRLKMINELIIVSFSGYFEGLTMLQYFDSLKANNLVY